MLPNDLLGLSFFKGEGMTKNQYRMLVVGTLIIALVGGSVDLVFGLLPQEIYIQLSMRESRIDQGVMLFLMAVFIAACLVSLYGTLSFKHWAPRLNIILAVFGLLILVADGAPSVQSSLSQALDIVGSFAEGLVLMLPFLHEDVKRMFWPQAE